MEVRRRTLGCDDRGHKSFTRAMELGALGQEAFEGASRDVDTAESKMSESV